MEIKTGIKSQLKTAVSTAVLAAVFWCLPASADQLSQQQLAQPHFSPTVTALPSNSNSGANPEFQIRLTKPKDDLNVRHLSSIFDKGMLGNPTSVTACAENQALIQRACPTSSLVGSAKVLTDGDLHIVGSSTLMGLNNYNVDGSVYFGEAIDGHHARLYIIIDPTVMRMGISGYDDSGRLYLSKDDYAVTSDWRYRLDNPVFDPFPDCSQGCSRLSLLAWWLEGRPVVVPVEIKLSDDFRVVATAKDLPQKLPASPGDPSVKKYDYLWGSDSFNKWMGGIEPNINPVPSEATVDLDLHTIEFSLDGSKGADRGRPFFRNSTECGLKQLSMDLESWPYITNPVPPGFHNPNPIYDSLTAQITGAVDLQRCQQLPFAPQSSIDLSTYKAREKATVKMAIEIPPGSADLSGSSIKFTGFGVDLSRGLATCPEATPTASCEDKTVIGSVKAYSPLLEPPMGGRLVLRGSQKQLGISLYLSGTVGKAPVSVDIPGDIEIGADGIKAVIKERAVPQVPVSRLEITMESATSVLTNPSEPGEYTLGSEFTGYNGARHSSKTKFSIVSASGTPEYDLTVRHRPKKRSKRAHVRLKLSCSTNDCQRARSATVGLPKKLQITAALRRRPGRLMRPTKGCKARIKGRKLSINCSSPKTALGVDIKRGLINPRRRTKLNYKATVQLENSESQSTNAKSVRIR